MTLSTNVLICNPQPIALVWDYVTQELLKRPDYVFVDSQHEAHDWEEKIRRGVAIERTGEPGQGALAWTFAKWNPDGPILVATEFAPMEEDEDGDLIATRWSDGSILLDFDTAYGFDQGGAGCSDLHAYFILRLFGEFGALWWENEYTGEWHLIDDKDSTKQLEALLELGDPMKGHAAVQLERALT